MTAKPPVFVSRFVIALAVALVAMAVSCAGPKAREKVLLPAVQTAWEGVQLDVDRGLADGIEDKDINSGAPVFLMRKHFAPGFAYVHWAQLRPWAERGIEDRVSDGEISPGVSLSLHERVFRFTEAVTRLNNVDQD